MLVLSLTLDAAPDYIRHFTGDSAGASYALARMIMNVVDWLLEIFGLEHDRAVVTFFYSAVVLGLALLAGWAVQRIVLGLVGRTVRRHGSDMYASLVRARFFHRLCRLIPPLVFVMLIQFTLSARSSLSAWLTGATVLYMVYVTAQTLSALIYAVWEHVDTRENKRKLPLKGVAQLARGVVWMVAAVIAVCLLLDKSPGTLLAGLGAFAAVLMLIFKDSILGLVAGVQLSENDSLHVGDWIAVGGTEANGTVEEVSLTAVKVLNWDKTTTTLPPYSLISGGFTNYRTMQMSGTRRICRCCMIDADSVLPATDEMLARIAEVPFMADYIARKRAQRDAGRVADAANPEGLADGTIDTNLGLFRAYMKMWLDANPAIAHDSDCFVTTLEQTSSGIPLQIYCFTATSAWTAYEAIQAAVFEQVAAMLHCFSLYTFENPSGRDTVVDGYLSPGGDISRVFGVPYPFYKPGAQPPAAP